MPGTLTYLASTLSLSLSLRTALTKNLTCCTTVSVFKLHVQRVLLKQLELIEATVNQSQCQAQFSPESSWPRSRRKSLNKLKTQGCHGGWNSRAEWSRNRPGMIPKCTMELATAFWTCFLQQNQTFLSTTLWSHFFFLCPEEPGVTLLNH
jgi:hypothetical protein